MTGATRFLLITAVLTAGAFAHAQEAAPWSIVPEREHTPVALSDRDALGLPGHRPRLTMNLTTERASYQPGSNYEPSAFSWSLEAWQLNTASLAHIQCNSAQRTIDAYLAQDCRFVDQPLPEDSVNLVQVRGDWTAAPGLNLGLGAFHSAGEQSAPYSVYRPAPDFGQGLALPASQYALGSAAEGMDLNVSFGIHTERVGEFLLGLQLARYRQRMSLSDLGLPQDHWAMQAAESSQYTNSAQLMLGWRRGNFSGEMLGHHRESPLWLGNEPAPSVFNSFDLEFSWHAPRNASISVGVSNVLDAAPRADEPGAEARLEDPMENIYGRIPYVRYKQDL